jgi:hypothetical protein
VLSGRIDLLFVVSIILSLLAFLFAASSFSASIDDGELRFTLSSPVSRSQLLFGKLIGGFLALLLPYLLGLALAGAIIAVVGLVFPPDWLFYAFLVLAVSVLFLFSQFTLAVLVCLTVPRASLIVLMFVWIIFTLVIPQTTPLIAELVYPALPRQTVDLEKELARHRCEIALVQELHSVRDSIVAAYGVNPDQLRHPLDPRATERDKTIQAIYWERVKPLVLRSQHDAADSSFRLDEQYQQTVRKQEGLARGLTLLTPVGCFGSFIAEISSTGVHEMENLKRNAALFHDQAVNAIYSRFTKEIYVRGENIVPTDREESLKSPPQVPYMAYERVDVAQIFPSLIAEVGILAFYAVALFVGVLVRFRTLNLVDRPSTGER